MSSSRIVSTVVLVFSIGPGRDIRSAEQVRPQQRRNDIDDETRAWQFDFTTVLVLLVFAVLLLIVTFEIRIPHH